MLWMWFTHDAYDHRSHMRKGVALTASKMKCWSRTRRWWFLLPVLSLCVWKRERAAFLWRNLFIDLFIKRTNKIELFWFSKSWKTVEDSVEKMDCKFTKFSFWVLFFQRKNEPCCYNHELVCWDLGERVRFQRKPQRDKDNYSQ